MYNHWAKSEFNDRVSTGWFPSGEVSLWITWTRRTAPAGVSRLEIGTILSTTLENSLRVKTLYCVSLIKPRLTGYPYNVLTHDKVDVHYLYCIDLVTGTAAICTELVLATTPVLTSFTLMSGG